LAHELNNPAAAVKRGADQLRDAVVAYASAIGELQARGLDPGDERLAVLLDTAAGDRITLSALERSDLEDEVEDALVDLGVDQPWAMTAGLVDGGMTPDDVRGIAAHFGAELAPTILRACDAAHATHALLDEVEEGAGRLSDIVGALKSYSYLDEAPVQEVDVAKGLEDTLLILKSELGDIEVIREYAEDLPSIEAFGSELNQVWTNLIDNAADAINEGGGSTITLRTAPARGSVVVEVEDDGPGIPSEVQSRVFDAFFTTKPPGSGTGLGLDISYGIIVHKHRGEISVQSEPGRTVFRVELPITPPSSG
jgi:signal transduction histidine kinase